MKPYIDISTGETGQPEYSIHRLDTDALNDVKTSIFILRNMLANSIKYKKYNGIDLKTRIEKRIAQLDIIIDEIKHSLLNKPV